MSEPVVEVDQLYYIHPDPLLRIVVSEPSHIWNGHLIAVDLAFVIKHLSVVIFDFSVYPVWCAEEITPVFIMNYHPSVQTLHQSY
jgi:hypothetical protein